MRFTLNLLRIAASTLNQIPLDFEGNKNRILMALEEASKSSVQVLCLPELSISGYGCEDAFFSLETTLRSEAVLQELLPHTKGMAVLFGMPVFHKGGLYNCAVMVCDGAVLGVNAKRQLPREGVHYEARWFRPWDKGRTSFVNLCGQVVPIGDHHYKFGDVGVGVEICEEAWGSSSLIAAHTDDLDIVLNPSASHFALGKCTQRELLVANASRALRVYYVYANLIGLESGKAIYDGGCLISHNGSIAKRGNRFSFNDFDLSYYDANLDLVRIGKIRGRAVESSSSHNERVPNVLQLGKLPVPKAVANIRMQKIIEADCMVKSYEEYDEFLRAEVLGLFDYLRKTGSQGYVVSLSGGCDSSATATLVAQMVAHSVNEMGLENAANRLGIVRTEKLKDKKELINKILFCVYQKTENSGKATQNAAAALAEELGAKFFCADVQPIVDGFLGIAKECLGRELNWQEDDVTLQNIQARARSPFAWILANVNDAILLTTSNRSECAVGYATMDGDTSGGLSPIAGIDKRFLRKWLVWAEQSCAIGLGPISSLKAVNDMEPTAELRPVNERHEGQKDEVDLMPYDVLERIERYFVRDRMGPEDIYTSLLSDFPDSTEDQLVIYINRFMDLWRKNQWKRERYAPSFHIDDVSLDPKSWCRYPILSGKITYEKPII